MTPTHTLKLADGYGTTQVELIKSDGLLSTVRITDNAYFEKPRYTVRVVRTADLTAL